jgi:adenine-specific DNA-methyltransferase
LSRLSDLVRQVGLTNETLAADLQREIAALADRRWFGLNFERHVPEAVELPGRPVRRGDKVRLLPPRGETTKQADDKLWQVTRIDRAGELPVAELVALADETEAATAALDDLVVVAEFRDPIYPGLVSTGKVERGGDKPFHTVINAENYHALQALLFTHRGKVDCIYIDPPYNTGNAEWIYSDRYVTDDDLYRHSKWLAFMERRLLLARELLQPTGVIIVAIGDDEHHRLRLLLDQTFGETNFISDVVWQGGRKNDSRYVSNGADYMLIYARDESALVAAGIRWSDRKQGVDDALAAASRAWHDAGGDTEEATKSFRQWIRQNKALLTDGVARYNAIDGAGRVYFAGDLSKPGPTSKSRYDLIHPTTGKPVKMHPNGWRASREKMDEWIAQDRILFGRDHTSTAYYKRYLDEQTSETIGSVFERDRRASTLRLKDILGDVRFPNAKDHEVLMRWLRIAAASDATIIDFFGGSGTTTEAVMRLNAQDGGTRRCILVTNNEVSSANAKALTAAGSRDGDPEWEALGVHDYVAKPRITTLVTGARPDGSTYEGAVEANVEFFTMTYEAPLRVASHRDFERIAPLLWLRAGSRGRRIDDVTKGWDVAEAYGVLADLDQVEPFVQAVIEQDGLDIAFIVTDEDRLFESVVRELPDHVEPVRLYEAYLRNFEIESGRGAR